MFGCKAFVHILKEERTKLDEKSTLCIFVGYADEEFGYGLWDPEKRKIIRSRDVVFLQDKKLHTTGSQNEKQQVVQHEVVDSFPVNLQPMYNNNGEDIVGDDVEDQ